MRRAVLSVLLLLAGSAAAEEIPWLGGYGYAFLGAEVANIGDLDGLATTDGIGADAEAPAVSYTFGGGGRVMYADFLLGGKGFGLFETAIDGAAGTATRIGGGGGFDLGYAVINRSDWLVAPFVGVGGMGLDVEVSNTSADAIRVGDRSLAAGESTTLRGGLAYAEVGIGGRWFVPGTDGGFMFGLEVGGMFSITDSEWDADDMPVGGLEGPGYTGGYIRLHLGGGGFFRR